LPAWTASRREPTGDMPKPRGLTVFVLLTDQPGIEILNELELCQESLTDGRIPDSDRIGELARAGR